MKKIFKNSLCILLLALAVAVTQIPADFAEADSRSTSSDADFQMNGTTLVKYTGTAQVVSVPASVSVIGEEAFANHPEMEAVLFNGKNLEKIDYRAFAGCSSLTELKLPDSIEEIGNGAFADCENLQTVSVGEGFRKLGIGVFAGCKLLHTFKIPKENPFFVMKDDCLCDKDLQKIYFMLPASTRNSYTMPASVADIAAYAFADCKHLETIIMSSSITGIPDYAFAGCGSIKNISIPYSVTQIGIKAFADCIALSDITVPETVKTIHETAFDGCRRLTVNAPEGSVAASFYEKWQEKNEVEYEDTGDYSEVNEDDPFNQISNDQAGDDREVGNILGSSYVVAGQAFVFMETSVEEANSSVVYENNYEKSTIIPKYTVTEEGRVVNQAYYRSQNLSEYTFPKITAIGEFSYARSNLKKAVIPNGVTSIGYGAFYHCEELTDVRIPVTVTEIAPKAFEKSAWLADWLSGEEEDFLIVGDGILLAYRGMQKNVVIPEGVKRIAPEVFAEQKYIETVTLPESLSEIGEGAFYKCSALTVVDGGENLTKIADRAFAGCPVSGMHIGEKVESLGLASFDFTLTDLPLEERYLVLESGNKLPETSYEKSAERLSAESYRTESLKGVEYILFAETGEQKNINGNDAEERSASIETDNQTGSLKNLHIDLKAEGGYIFTATDAEDKYTDIKKAYRDVFQTELQDYDELCVDFTLTDKKQDIPVTRFGKEDLQVFVTLPDSFSYADLRIFTLDSDGQLENVNYSKNGCEVSFYVNHLSAYAFVNLGDVNIYGQESVHTNQAVFTSLHKLDESPDTGDFLHPKWFLALGLGGLAVAIYFWKKK